MPRKRGIIENFDWQYDKGTEQAPENNEPEPSENDPGEDFLQAFLKEQREKRNPNLPPEPLEQEKHEDAGENKTKSIYELAMEELKKEQEGEEDESGSGVNVLDRLKDLSVKVTPAVKKLGGVVIAAGNKIKETKNKAENMKPAKTKENPDTKTREKETGKNVLIRQKLKKNPMVQTPPPVIYGTNPAPLPETERKLAGTLDLVFLGLDNGVGTTYSAFLCASALKGHYKTCVLEFNKSGHFAEIFEYVNQEIPGKRRMYRYEGIDYYFNINYSDFLAEFRQKYDFVIIDAGNISCIDDYTRIMHSTSVFVIARGDEWRLKQLKNTYAQLSLIDRSHSWIYLITLKSVTKDVKKIIRGNRVASLPFSPSPYRPTSETIGLFHKMLGLYPKNNKQIGGEYVHQL